MLASVPIWLGFGAGAIVLILVPLLLRAYKHSDSGIQARARKIAAAGRLQEAARLLVDAGKANDAIELLKSLRRSDEAARVHLHLGQFVQAAELFTLVADHEAASNAWKKAGRPKEAAKSVERLGRMEPAGDLYLAAGENKDALRCYEAAGQLRKAAEVYGKLGDKKNASQTMAKFLTQQGDFADAAKHWMAAGQHRNAAEALYRAGNFQASAKLFDRLGEFKSAAKAMMRAGDIAGAAANLEKTGELTAALRLYESAKMWNKVTEILKRQKNWVALGNIMMRMDKPDLAIEFYRRVSPLEEAYIECAMSMASILEHQGDSEEAMKKYAEILEFKGVSSGTSRALFSLASLCEKLGKPALAMPYLQRMSAGGPLGDKVHNWLERLEHQVVNAARTMVGGIEVATEEEAKTGKIAFNLPKRDSLADRYDITDKIGQGGHGVIYKAFDKTLGREVVLKFLFKNQLPDDLAIRYFLREAKTTASLNHPNIVTLYDMGEVSGNLYLAMEYIKGMDLEQHLTKRGGPLAFSEVGSLVKQVCSALQYAHDKTVIHRDIKPGNIMLTGEKLGKVKLMDFGLAKALDENPTKTLIVCGTPLYMSPEQIAGDFVDHRSDIYSLAVLVFQLVTGITPFPASNILAHHQFTPPPHPTSLNKDLPVEAAEVILKGLEKQRDQRYQRTMDFADDLWKAMQLGEDPPAT